MITVNYLTFREMNKIINATGGKLNSFESVLKSAFSGNSYIVKAGELIDDYLVLGEHQYLVNHDFADCLSVNYESADKTTQSQCLSLQSSMQNWLVARAQWYARKYNALEKISDDNKTVTESSSSSESSNSGSSSTTTDQDTKDVTARTTDRKGGADRKFIDTPETEADYSGNSHITNLTKETNWDYTKEDGTVTGTLDSTVTGTTSDSGSSSGKGTVTTTAPTAEAYHDRLTQVVWPLYEDFKRRWAMDACLLGEGI